MSDHIYKGIEPTGCSGERLQAASGAAIEGAAGNIGGRCRLALAGTGGPIEKCLPRPQAGGAERGLCPA